GGAGSDRSASQNPSADAFPVLVGLQAAFAANRPGILIVNKHDVVSNEDFVLESNALADKRVTGDFAPTANPGSLLNLDKRANLNVVADFAPVKIRKAVDAHVFAEFHIPPNVLAR